MRVLKELCGRHVGRSWPALSQNINYKNKFTPEFAMLNKITNNKTSYYVYENFRLTPDSQS